MNELLTAEELATALKMSWQVVLRWHRAGRIKSELRVGRSPRFDLRKVKKHLAEEQAKRDRENYNGMVPTL